MDILIYNCMGYAENGQGNVKSDVNLAVLDVLNREGIEIPFPQRVVRAIVSTANDGVVAEGGALEPGTVPRDR